ncbi:MAG: hypothetical protein FD147_109 [Chloroflexi bacterium]|nr:MAG: hypothetical protein FD147_109 [Chloroflexota bacterium]
MKIYSNEKLIKRNNRAGNITSLLSIAILGVGMFFSFKDKDGTYLPLTFTALIVGFLLFQVGNYFTNRWGKSPRPDEKLSLALKGLDEKFTLYHYQTSVSHLLVGPAGIFCLLPYNQPGMITYDAIKDRWKQSGGNFFLKTFGGDSMGRPNLDSKYALIDILKYFEKKGVDLGAYTPEPIIVFTNDKAYVFTEESPVNAVTAEKLKEFIRKRTKTNVVSAQLIKVIQESINPI